MNKDESLISLKYEIKKDDFARGGEASRKIKKMLTQLGIDSKIIRRTSIITYEAEMNIIIHSLGGYLDVEVNPNSIDIKAIDKGPGIEDINLAMKEGYSTAPNKIKELGFGAGMGLPNMKKSSDEFFIMSSKDGGTKILMKINLF